MRWAGCFFAVLSMLSIVGCSEDGEAPTKEDSAPKSGTQSMSERAMEEGTYREEWFWHDRLLEPPPSAARPGSTPDPANWAPRLKRLTTAPLTELEPALEEMAADGAAARNALCREIDTTLDASEDDPHRRYRMLMALARVNGPEAAPTLVRLLRDPLQETSTLAAELLGECDAPWVTPRLLKSFGKWENNRDILTRVMAIEALTKYRIYSGLPQLVALLAENTAQEVPDTERNWKRTTRMAFIKDEVRRILREISGESYGFDSGQGEAVMREAVGKWQDWWRAHEHEYLLGERTPHDAEDAGLREQIQKLIDIGFPAFQLRNVDNARWLLEHLGPIAVPQLMAALDRPELRVRVHAAEVLGRIGDERARAAFAARIPREPEASARAQMIEALGDIGNEEDAPTLTKILESESEDTSVRVAAALALGNIGGDAAMTALDLAAGSSSDDTSKEIAVAVWSAKALHGDDASFESLLSLLASKSLAERAQGSTALLETFHASIEYDPYSDEEKRTQGIEAWREWWANR
ncbi:MAG: HEAT repeat domain-containing protein [Planctomycetota bacterium]